MLSWLRPTQTPCVCSPLPMASAGTQPLSLPAFALWNWAAGQAGHESLDVRAARCPLAYQHCKTSVLKVRRSLRTLPLESFCDSSKRTSWCMQPGRGSRHVFKTLARHHRTSRAGAGGKAH